MSHIICFQFKYCTHEFDIEREPKISISRNVQVINGTLRRMKAKEINFSSIENAEKEGQELYLVNQRQTMAFKILIFRTALIRS